MAPRTHILVQDPKSGSRLGGGEVLSNNGTSKKHDFALEIVPGLRKLGFPRPKWFVWNPGGLWASQFPPKPSYKIVLQGFPPIPGVSGEHPLGPWWPAYFPFVGLCQWLFFRKHQYELQHILAPFGIPTSGLCMVVQPATLILLTLDPNFGAPGLGRGPGRPRLPFWNTNGSPKSMFLWRDRSPEVSRNS